MQRVRIKNDVMRDQLKNRIFTFHPVAFDIWRTSRNKEFKTWQSSPKLCATYLWPWTSSTVSSFVIKRKEISVGIRSRFSSKKAARFLKCFDSCQALLRWLVFLAIEVSTLQERKNFRNPGAQTRRKSIHCNCNFKDGQSYEVNE